MDVSGLELSQSLPLLLATVLMLGVKVDLDVVLADLVAKEHDLFAAGHRGAALRHPANGQVGAALWRVGGSQSDKRTTR